MYGFDSCEEDDFPFFGLDEDEDIDIMNSDEEEECLEEEKEILPRPPPVIRNPREPPNTINNSPPSGNELQFPNSQEQLNHNPNSQNHLDGYFAFLQVITDIFFRTIVENDKTVSDIVNNIDNDICVWNIQDPLAELFRDCYGREPNAYERESCKSFGKFVRNLILQLNPRFPLSKNMIISTNIKEGRGDIRGFNSKTLYHRGPNFPVDYFPKTLFQISVKNGYGKVSRGALSPMGIKRTFIAIGKVLKLFVPKEYSFMQDEGNEEEEEGEDGKDAQLAVLSPQRTLIRNIKCGIVVSTQKLEKSEIKKTQLTGVLCRYVIWQNISFAGDIFYHFFDFRKSCTVNKRNKFKFKLEEYERYLQNCNFTVEYSQYMRLIVQFLEVNDGKPIKFIWLVDCACDIGVKKEKNKKKVEKKELYDDLEGKVLDLLRKKFGSL